MTTAVQSLCGEDAADWLNELLYHVREPYVTCWRCSQSDAGLYFDHHDLSYYTATKVFIELGQNRQKDENGKVTVGCGSGMGFSWG